MENIKQAGIYTEIERSKQKQEKEEEEARTCNSLMRWRHVLELATLTSNKQLAQLVQIYNRKLRSAIQAIKQKLGIQR